MVVIAVLLTYFLGCIWYLFVSPQLGLNDPTDNFITANDLADLTLKEKLVVCCYFVLTTLSTVGKSIFDLAQ